MNKYTPTFVFLLLCLIFVFFNMGCGSATPITTSKAPIVRVPTKITSYPLKDYKGVEHKYRDDFDSFVFPQDNTKLTQYCAFHHQWGDIKVVYRRKPKRSSKQLGRNKGSSWGYEYVVTLNKKSWK